MAYLTATNLVQLSREEANNRINEIILGIFGQLLNIHIDQSNKNQAKNKCSCQYCNNLRLYIKDKIYAHKYNKFHKIDKFREIKEDIKNFVKLF